MSAELENAFHRLAPVPSGPPPIPDIIRRGRRQRTRVVLAIVAAAAVTALAVPVAVDGALTMFRGREDTGPAGTGLANVSTVELDGTPHSVAYGEGSVWVPTSQGTVQRIDPVSDEVSATIRVLEKRRSGGPSRLVGEDGEDLGPAPARPIGTFGTITTGEGAVWVTAHFSDGCRLFKISPEKNAVTEEVRTPCYPLLVADGSVWVGAGQDDERPNQLIQLDAVTLQEVGGVQVGACCMSGITSADGYIWVGRQDVSNVSSGQSGDGNPVREMKLGVLQVDPEAKELLDEVELEGDIYHPGDTLLSNSMAAHSDAVWITRPEAAVVERVSTTGAVDASTRTPDLRLPDYPVAGPGWLAVSDLNASKIALLDADTAEILDVHDTGIVIGGTPATDGRFLWVPDADNERVMKLQVDL